MEREGTVVAAVQAAPAFLDRDATVDRAVTLIAIVLVHIDMDPSFVFG